jgi:hypothetical protein
MSAMLCPGCLAQGCLLLPPLSDTFITCSWQGWMGLGVQLIMRPTRLRTAT